MSRQLTDEQRAAIEARGKVIVSASAGSGKTFVMIERLVSLILAGEDVKSVLCVTFTNKAAAQMRERLRLALIKKIGETAGEERERLKTQLSALPLADISTIHAFCARLIRTHFYALGTDPSFRIISPDDAEGKSLSARALEEVFENAYEQGGEAFSRLLSVYFKKKKDTRLKGIVLGLYDSVRGSADYRGVLGKIGREDLFPLASEDLYQSYSRRAEFLAQELEKRGGLLARGGARAVAAKDELISACENLLASCSLFDMVSRSQTPPAIGRMPASNKAEGEVRGALKFLSGASKAVKALYAELKEYECEEVERARYESARTLARALASLATGYDEIYSRLKREANVLDYNDLEHFALAVLSDKAVSEEIRSGYRFVFVDEYQDVNPVQEEIISRLGCGETFLVGDSKQAIYGFRGSRSEYFEEKESVLEHSLRLTKNFRSAPEVLSAVNRVFEPILGRYVPMCGSERYDGHAGEVLFHTQAEREEEETERGVYSVLTGAGGEQTDALAEQVADLVEAECDAEWYDADEEKTKPVTFADIAVLARKNTGDAERIVSALARRGIPVSSSTKTNVCDYFEARLLIDWLSFLDNAEQDIPLATAMLSAIGSFTEEELAQIRLRFPSPRTFRAACKQYAEKMKNPLSEKLAAFFKTAEELRILACVRTAAEMIGTLLSQGLEVQIAARRGGRERLARVRRLKQEAEPCGSVHDFLARLKAADYRVDFSETSGDGAVKVLTMHASKGLEYPVVILAGMDGAFHGADRDEVLYTERYLAAPKCYDEENKLVYETVLRRASRVLQEEQEIKEEGNLLYVAMTRAKFRLHMLFEERDHALSPCFAKRFSDFVDFSACADLFCGERIFARPPLVRNALVSLPEQTSQREMEKVYRVPYAFEESTRLPVKSSATALMKTERLAMRVRPVSADGGNYQPETGTAYHAFLEHVVFGRSAKEELARMREEGLLSEEQCALLDEERLEAILEIPCLKALAGKRVRREQTFLVRLPANEILPTEATDEIVFQGAIDLLYEGGNGYEIIDYKFSSHDDERIRADYALQIKLYKKAVARATRTDEKNITARIVNIALCREIPM